MANNYYDDNNAFNIRDTGNSNDHGDPTGFPDQSPKLPTMEGMVSTLRSDRHIWLDDNIQLPVLTPQCIGYWPGE